MNRPIAIIKKVKHSFNPSKNKNSSAVMLENKESRHFMIHKNNQPIIIAISGYSNIFQTHYKNKTYIFAVLYHRMKLLSGNGFIIIVVYVKEKITILPFRKLELR